MSKTPTYHRESRDEKSCKRESASVTAAIQESLATYSDYREKTTFHSLGELYDKALLSELDNWTVSKKNNNVYFFHIGEMPSQCCVAVSHNLNATVFYDNTEVKSLSVELNNTNDIEKLLQHCNNLITKNKNPKASVDLLTVMLENLLLDLPEHTSTIKFMVAQLKLFTSHKNKFRYTWEMILFCGLVHSISPHAYKFLRSSGNFILPSPSTLQRVCSNFSTDPRLEQHDDNFLQYAAAKFKLITPEDKLVVLMVDEIHLNPYMDYKGGNLVGNAYNNTNIATGAHTFMVASLKSSFKDVVHILPVNTFKAPDLHMHLKKIVLGLENIGYEVIGVVSDNNPVNRKQSNVVFP